MPSPVEDFVSSVLVVAVVDGAVVGNDPALVLLRTTPGGPDGGGAGDGSDAGEDSDEEADPSSATTKSSTTLRLSPSDVVPVPGLGG